jgi:phage recombination protein Bet
MQTAKNAEAQSGTVDRALVETWLKVTEEGKKLTPDESETFIAVAVAHNLNPFCRELHASIQYDNGARKMMLITGFEVYLKRAAESGLLDGYSARLEGEGDNLKAITEIHRKDWKSPFIGEAYFTEVAQKDEKGELTSFWKRSGRYMLRKVCLSQSFRLAFPEVLAGLPYEGSEVPSGKAEAKLSVRPEAAKPASQPFSSSSPRAADKRADDAIGGLVDEIKALALANQGILKPHHLSWIIEQLGQPKSVRQLEGLKVHVEKAVAEAKAAPAAQNPQGQGVIRHLPTRLRPRGQSTPPNSGNTAAGAEGLIF